MLSYGLRKGLRHGLPLATINCLFLFAISPTMDLQDIMRADIFFPMLGLAAIYVVGSMLRYSKNTLESEYQERKAREDKSLSQEV